MNTMHRKSVFTALAALLICATALPMAKAQETSKGAAVIYPVIYSRNSGTETSRMTGLNSVREVLQKAGYTLISSTVAAHTWRRMGIPMPMTDRPASLSDLIRFGKEVKARYVVSPVFDFNSRSIWVDLGPKTVSTAMVDIRITDVDQGQIVYTRDDVTGRSDEKFDLLLAGADLITPLFTVVSGGPKTPHEQRAVQIAVSKALRGWVKTGE
jgi:hypothetical protein